MRNQANGLPIEGAGVAIKNVATQATQSTTTAADGSYLFAGIVAGTYYETVSRSGYDPDDATVTVAPLQSRKSDMTLKPAATGFRVISVKSKYSNGATSYFLPGVSFNVAFNAMIDWDTKEPFQVIFTTPRGDYPVWYPTGATVSKTFDVGTEFDPCTILKVKAIALDGSETAVATADFVVTKPFLSNNFSVVDEVDFSGRWKYSYKPTLTYNNATVFSLGTLGVAEVSSGIALWGGNPFLFRLLPKVEHEFGSDGKGTTKMKWKNSFAGKGFEDKFRTTRSFKSIAKNFQAYLKESRDDSIPTFRIGKDGELSFFPFINIDQSFDKKTCGTSDTGWIYSGSLGLAGDFSWNSPVHQSVQPVGPIPVPWYAKWGVKAAGDISLRVYGATLDQDAAVGTLALVPSIAGTFGVGVNDVAAGEGTLTGTVDMKFTYPTKETEGKFYLEESAKLYVGPWEWNTTAYRQTFCLFGACQPAAKVMALPAPAIPTLISRDYAATPQAGQMLASPKILPKTLGLEALNENAPATIVPAIFPNASTTLSSSGANVNLLWTNDNGARSAMNRTMLVHSSYNGSTWSPTVPVADNGTADFNPASLTFADGTVVAAWEDVKRALPDTATFEEMLAQQEIAVSIFSPQLSAWGPQVTLTANGSLDRSPRLAGKTKDNLMLTWIHNDQNDIYGSPAKPNTLYYARYNGTGWSQPEVVATIPYGIKRYSLVYDGSTAHVAISLDTDGNSATINDLELYRVSYSNGSWGGMTRLTDDAAIDDNPQLSLNGTNTAVLTWVKDGELSSVVNFDFAHRTVIRAEANYSSALADYRQTVSTDGKVAIIYADTSDNSSSDLFGAFFDPLFIQWGAPRQLTFDAETEMRPSIAFQGADTVIAVYNRKLLLNSNGTPTVGAQTDLSMLKHRISDDLALDPDTLLFSPPNASAGETVTLSVTARNVGDRSARDVPVRFYNGDPSSGGMLIGSTTIDGVFKPGDERPLSLGWTQPETAVPVTIFAIIDPDSAYDTLNRSNNTVSRVVALPDLALQGIRAEKISGARYQLTVPVVNLGGTSSSTTAITLRYDNDKGKVITTIPVAPLARFQSADYTSTLDLSTLQGPETTVFATVDEGGGIQEVSKDNNSTRATIVLTGATLTVTVNGTGGGTITSDPVGTEPSGISCNAGTCTTTFPFGTTVRLLQTPNVYSVFGGWGGDCAGAGPCTFGMTGPKTVTAGFMPAPVVKNITNNSDHATLSDALTKATAGAELYLLNGVLSGSYVLDKQMKLKGGWNSSFNGSSGIRTAVSGGLTVTGRWVSLEMMDVIGKVKIRGGTLKGKDVKIR